MFYKPFSQLSSTMEGSKEAFHKMKKEIKTAVFDEELQIEAYRFEGTSQPFPNHFHEYYVIGFVERGQRCLLCRDREYSIRPGDVLLFQPGENHGCAQTGEETLDYRGLNITKEVMEKLVKEITGQPKLPGFSHSVIRDEEINGCLHALHESMMKGSSEFDKEEQLYQLLSLLIQRYGQPFCQGIPECGQEIARACRFMEEHYRERIFLDQICREAGLSKSTLLRAFTRTKGVTPYCYLQNIRIGAARKLLEQGTAPVEAALGTGFFDQSHFTNYFNRFIGLSPGAYREIFQKKTEEAGGEDNGK